MQFEHVIAFLRAVDPKHFDAVFGNWSDTTMANRVQNSLSLYTFSNPNDVNPLVGYLRACADILEQRRNEVTEQKAKATQPNA